MSLWWTSTKTARTITYRTSRNSVAGATSYEFTCFIANHIFPAQMKEIKTLDPLKVAPEHRN